MILADMRQLYLYASGMYSIGQADLMQPCCLHYTGDAKADTDMQRDNTDMQRNNTDIQRDNTDK